MKMPGVLITLRNSLLAVILVILAGCSDDVKVGSIITFGRYPQTLSDEVKPIEWRVIEVKDGKAFLLADKGLDAVPYNKTDEDVTWKTSSIRRWLNTDFYYTAFNDSEKSRIAITVLKNPDNPEYGTKGGDDTQDRIFLLSPDDAEWYLMHYDEKIIKPTPYAVKRGVGAWGTTMWWLRPPGPNQRHASVVDTHGALFPYGGRVSHYIAVRPALWVNL